MLVWNVVIFAYLAFCLLSVFLWKFCLVCQPICCFLRSCPVLMYFCCCAFELRRSRLLRFLSCIHFDGCMFRENVQHALSKKSLATPHWKEVLLKGCEETEGILVFRVKNGHLIAFCVCPGQTWFIILHFSEFVSTGGGCHGCCNWFQCDGREELWLGHSSSVLYTCLSLEQRCSFLVFFFLPGVLSVLC